jgi:four helix bundle protein
MAQNENGSFISTGGDMSTANYRDLIARNKAFEFALAVYRESSNFPVEERYGLKVQLRRASISIPSNIAEGEGRGSGSEFRRYLVIALGSLKEAETQILLSEALGYFKENQAANLMKMAAEVGRLINGLSRSLRNK